MCRKKGKCLEIQMKPCPSVLPYLSDECQCLLYKFPLAPHPRTGVLGWQPLIFRFLKDRQGRLSFLVELWSWHHARLPFVFPVPCFRRRMIHDGTLHRKQQALADVPAPAQVSFPVCGQCGLLLRWCRAYSLLKKSVCKRAKPYPVPWW